MHGTEIRKVHFHEVGAIDSIADIVGTAIALDQLGIERIEASPVPTGHGYIEIAHGRCSIPAPATAELLKGIPLAPSEIEAELTTPTGAAMLAALSTRFGPPPAMALQKIGYGAGTHEFEQQANLLRVLIGEALTTADRSSRRGAERNIVSIGDEFRRCQWRTDRPLCELADRSRALDVFTTAIQMKKNRPGVLLSVLCETADAARMEAIIFRETTTLGVRRMAVSRRKLRAQDAQGKYAVGTDRRCARHFARWRETIFAGV